MTDKQIIIDGVDVSGCEFYTNNGWCCCALVYDDYCKDFNKCIYKLANKLQAKEQECEELKEKVKKMNEVIRTETTRCSLVYFLQTDLDQLKSENKHLNDLLNQALKELEKTRETLTEIKEIVGIGLVDGLQPEEYSGFLKILQAQILQKISECEVE